MNGNSPHCFVDCRRRKDVDFEQIIGVTERFAECA